jgi:hypothetical protein
MLLSLLSEGRVWYRFAYHHGLWVWGYDKILLNALFSFWQQGHRIRIAFPSELTQGDTFRCSLERCLLEDAHFCFLLIELSQSVIKAGNADLHIKSVGPGHLFGS